MRIVAIEGVPAQRWFGRTKAKRLYSLLVENQTTRSPMVNKHANCRTVFDSHSAPVFEMSIGG